MKEQSLTVNNLKSFNLTHIFECGQCFRWNKQENGSYTGVFKNNVINVKKENNNIIFSGICSGDIKKECINYFDLNTNYEKIKEKLSSIDDYLKTSIVYGEGIRILNQDLWETLISFIISANNNIPRIKGIIDKLSKAYGNKIIWNKKDYYTFPTPKQLSKASIQDLRNLGLGFRDIRVYETTKMINENNNILKQLQNEKDVNVLREKLLDRRVISFTYLTNRNGEEAYEMIKFAGVRHPEDRDDNIVHAVGACITDVDSETRANLERNEALSLALNVANEASKAKTTFLSNMSHEIRTPLNAVIGLDAMALNDPNVKETTKDYLRKIASSAEHLLDLINDILDMSRIESGRMNLRNEEFAYHNGTIVNFFKSSHSTRAKILFFVS